MSPVLPAARTIGCWPAGLPAGPRRRRDLRADADSGGGAPPRSGPRHSGGGAPRQRFTAAGQPVKCTVNVLTRRPSQDRVRAPLRRLGDRLGTSGDQGSRVSEPKSRARPRRPPVPPAPEAAARNCQHPVAPAAAHCRTSVPGVPPEPGRSDRRSARWRALGERGQICSGPGRFDREQPVPAERPPDRTAMGPPRRDPDGNPRALHRSGVNRRASTRRADRGSCPAGSARSRGSTTSPNGAKSSGLPSPTPSSGAVAELVQRTSPGDLGTRRPASGVTIAQAARPGGHGDGAQRHPRVATARPVGWVGDAVPEEQAVPPRASARPATLRQEPADQPARRTAARYSPRLIARHSPQLQQPAPSSSNQPARPRAPDHDRRQERPLSAGASASARQAMPNSYARRHPRRD